MAPTELRSQADKLRLEAARYRDFASRIQPNLPGPHDKAYYLTKAQELESQADELESQADELESQAREVLRSRFQAPTLTTASEPESKPAEPEPEPALTLKEEIRVHSLLALAVLADKRHVCRPFVIWLILRQQDRTNKTWFTIPEVIEFFVAVTGKDKRTVRRWIDSGNGIFWDVKKKNRIWLYTKNRLFADYKLSKPGRVLLVPASLLTSSTKQLRAALYGCWTNGRTKWVARSKFDREGEERKFSIEQLTGLGPRTQFNYEKVNGQEEKKKFTYAIDKPVEERQKPNKYFPVFKAVPGKKKKTRYNLYSPEISGAQSAQGQALSVVGSTNGTVGAHRDIVGKICFDNPNRAKAAAVKRAQAGSEGECYAEIGESIKGNVLLKTVPYSENL